MTITLPYPYQNADVRNADVTQTMLDLFNVVAQINAGSSPLPNPITVPVNISTNSTSPALTVTQIGTGNSLLIEDSPSPDSTPFVVDTNGALIVGNTAVVATGPIAATPKVQVHGTNNNGSSIGLFNWASNSAISNSLELLKSNSGVIGTRSLVSATGTTLGFLSCSGDDGTNFVESSRIEGALDSTGSAGIMPGRWVLSTANSSGVLTERIRVDSTGATGFGAIPNGNSNIVLSKAITGNVNFQNIWSVGTVQADVTSNARMFSTSPATAAASFTLTGLTHYNTVQGTIGAGSTVTNQYGFAADSSLTGATNNYGFYGNIASGSNRYNIYMNGTADNYIAGSVGIGSTPGADTKLGILGTYPTSGNITYVTKANGTIPSATTTGAVIFQSAPSTQATAFTCGSLWHFQAVQGTIGAGSSVTTQYGFNVDSTLTGATSNFGFYSNIASAANRWNFFANGTANNAFAGNTKFGAATVPSVAVDVTGAVSATGAVTAFNATAVPAGGAAGTGVLMSSVANLGLFFGSNAPTLSAAQGSIYIRTDGSSTSTRLYINTNGSTTWTNVVTAA